MKEKTLLNGVTEVVCDNPFELALTVATGLAQKFQTTCPYSIANYLGIDVYFEALPEHVNGFLYREEKSNMFIVINNKLSSSKKRFVCARELGQARRDNLGTGMNPEKLIKMSGEPSLQQKTDVLADFFSYCLLTEREQLLNNEDYESFCNRINVPFSRVISLYQYMIKYEPQLATYMIRKIDFKQNHLNMKILKFVNNKVQAVY